MLDSTNMTADAENVTSEFLKDSTANGRSVKT